MSANRTVRPAGGPPQGPLLLTGAFAVFPSNFLLSTGYGTEALTPSQTPLGPCLVMNNVLGSCLNGPLPKCRMAGTNEQPGLRWASAVGT